MNYTNSTVLSCGLDLSVPLPSPESISLALRAVIIFRITVNAVSCPFVILLNILVMVAVKTKRHLRIKSNISLACLATTDLVVGFAVQPLQIVIGTFILKGETDIICWLAKITSAITTRCTIASFNHFVLLSGERHLAIKHPFAYENLVTEARIIIASGLAWAVAIILPIYDFWPTNRQFVVTLIATVMLFIFLPLVVYFNVAVYKEVRRNAKQIIANQVSLEEREKLLRNKKAFYCTATVLLAIFLCYLPVNIYLITIISFKDSIPINVKHMFDLVTIFPVLNSLFNPLIYAVRIRYFRVAFIHLLSRKTLAQVEQLERNMFGGKQTGVVATAEQGQNRVSRGNEVLQLQ